MASYWKGPVKATPDYRNILKVLRREKPSRPTLFEFFLNGTINKLIAGPEAAARVDAGEIDWMGLAVLAYRNAGYDYANVQGSAFTFPREERHREKSISLNEAPVITDRASLNKYPWPDPDVADYTRLDTYAKLLADGMKLIVWGPGGVLENVISLTGYDNLCFMLIDDPALVQELFDAVGSRFVRYYQRCISPPAVCAMISNDDWGFKSQTMISPADMRKYVFPWHTRIVDVGHKAGKPVILHSCGNLKEVMDDIIDDMKYDAKHSYEDTIQPVEQAYEQYGRRIAILGGIDVDFVCRSTPDQVYTRSKEVIARTGCRGYALGTGNSVPEYVPQENYFAMIAAANEGK
ncbi:hypothetical protein GX586_12995 [bacterium]|nr:hypothetical protein [bacterium]